MAGISEDLRTAWQRCERRQKEKNVRDVSAQARRLAAMDGASAAGRQLTNPPYPSGLASPEDTTHLAERILR
ncbi:hypothetical protein MES4922_180016 [Mesorhizobium ventifaucium]|uniref:Uncharacterized protein n=1 Tax=Mesorhizobium ventifaucium TaxID=666020 RepID=A0ABN8JFH9_9HYPH|nr:hypothetical protein MES4922_180016 [Mesorhizobium ventifaucium]